MMVADDECASSNDEETCFIEEDEPIIDSPDHINDLHDLHDFFDEIDESLDVPDWN